MATPVADLLIEKLVLGNTITWPYAVATPESVAHVFHYFWVYRA